MVPSVRLRRHRVHEGGQPARSALSRDFNRRARAYITDQLIILP